MKILLDTHIALWAVVKTDALSQAAKDFCFRKEMKFLQCYFSMGSQFKAFCEPHKHGNNSCGIPSSLSGIRSY